MGLEDQANFIADLDEANPLSTDLRRQGDDHLRLIKRVLKNTFPNMSAQTLVGPTELDYVQNVTSDIQEQLDAKLEEATLDLSSYAKFDVAQTFTKNQKIAIKDHGIVGGTGASLIIDCDLSDTHKITIGGSLVMSFSNLSNGQNITLKLVHQANGNTAGIILPSQLHFAYGADPVLSNQNGQYDIIAGKVIDGFLVCGFLGNLS